MYLLALLLVLASFYLTEAIQCYSCKATGVNELDANIKCLENAYLENCAEFYHYYNEIEGQTLPGDDYYYYDPQGQGELGQGRPKRGQVKPDLRGRPPVNAEGAPYAGPLRPNLAETSRRNKRATRGKPSTKDGKEESEAAERKKAEDKKEAEEYEYEYEYEYEEEDSSKNKTGFIRPKGPEEELKDDHYCYNTASKSGWENYVVEKGCKRIAYCKNNLANKPEWGNSWNFCCDKSRCNVKLVKDKPQRVFGMGCRHTDDCIQGHTSRPICPEFFKTCPKLSNSMIKMECRTQARTMASVKMGTKYRQAFRDKKCYCAKGYYPKGPICTSAAENLTYQWTAIAGLISQLTLAIFFH